jgi:hypothetical protein
MHATCLLLGDGEPKGTGVGLCVGAGALNALEGTEMAFIRHQITGGGPGQPSAGWRHRRGEAGGPGGPDVTKPKDPTPTGGNCVRGGAKHCSRISGSF